MNLSKSLEYFDPLNQIDGSIHVIGIGAMGSRVTELLVRLGINKIHIWDMDTVEDKNITNQLYFHHQIGMNKTDALEEILLDIKLYQKIPFRSHFYCKFIPTCSNYAIEAINEYGSK